MRRSSQIPQLSEKPGHACRTADGKECLPLRPDQAAHLHMRQRHIIGHSIQDSQT